MAQWNLQIDAGNSSVKWRLLSDTEIYSNGRCSYLDFFSHLQSLFSENTEISSVSLVSVAGIAFDNRLKTFLAENYSLQLKVAIVERRTAGVVCAYEKTSQLGIDRWMAILAAAHSFSGPKLVVDMGSALTIDFISASHEHLGGYIVPGWGLIKLALENGTQINHDRIPNSYESASIEPGKNTFDAIGMGRLKLMSSIIESSYADFSSDQKDDVTLVFTGGDAVKIIPHLSMPVSYVEDLVLDGLSLAMDSK